VYPIAMGASICSVAAGSVLVFKEKVGLYGKLEILIRLPAAVLLSLGG
jgi:multidrug transporter EmrE-like cation transporter